MNMMARIRIYHAALATLSILSYLTGELGLVHAWLGYGVAVVIVFRLLWALSGERQVGLMRFYPSFKGLNLEHALTHPAISKSLLLAIALSVIAATGTGVAIDQGRALGFSGVNVATTADAEDHERSNGEREGENEVMEEAHEFFANLMLLFVGMHVTYLFLFKRPLAKYMLFLEPTRLKQSR